MKYAKTRIVHMNIMVLFYYGLILCYLHQIVRFTLYILAFTCYYQGKHDQKSPYIFSLKIKTLTKLFFKTFIDVIQILLDKWVNLKQLFKGGSKLFNLSVYFKNPFRRFNIRSIAGSTRLTTLVVDLRWIALSMSDSGQSFCDNQSNKIWNSTKTLHSRAFDINVVRLCDNDRCAKLLYENNIGDVCPVYHWGG